MPPVLAAAIIELNQIASLGWQALVDHNGSRRGRRFVQTSFEEGRNLSARRQPETPNLWDTSSLLNQAPVTRTAASISPYQPRAKIPAGSTGMMIELCLNWLQAVRIRWSQLGSFHSISADLSCRSDSVNAPNSRASERRLRPVLADAQGYSSGRLFTTEAV